MKHFHLSNLHCISKIYPHPGTTGWISRNRSTSLSEPNRPRSIQPVLNIYPEISGGFRGGAAVFQHLMRGAFHRKIFSSSTPSLRYLYVSRFKRETNIPLITWFVMKPSPPISAAPRAAKQLPASSKAAPKCHRHFLNRLICRLLQSLDSALRLLLPADGGGGFSGCWGRAEAAPLNTKKLNDSLFSLLNSLLCGILRCTLCSSCSSCSLLLSFLLVCLGLLNVFLTSCLEHLHKV